MSLKREKDYSLMFRCHYSRDRRGWLSGLGDFMRVEKAVSEAK